MDDQLQFHPLADCFPLMAGEAFDKFCTLIKEEGLLHKMVLFDGKILDGRNRYRALQKVNGTVSDDQFKKFEGSFDAARRLVVTENLTGRRHLTVNQRREAAAKLANCKEGNPQLRTVAEFKEITVAQAAALLGVKPRSVETVRQYERLKADGLLKPEEIRAVDAGTKAHSVVVRQARDRIKRKQQATSEPTEWRKKVNEGAYRRFMQTVASLETASDGINTHDIPPLTAKDKAHVRSVVVTIRRAASRLSSSSQKG